MLNKTKGQLEADISSSITSFEKEQLGRGPQEVRTFIIQDMILVRIKGVLTPAEKNWPQKLMAHDWLNKYECGLLKFLSLF